VTKITAACITLLFILRVSTVRAQSATPTNNVLTRVLMVESQYGRGSIFSLDVDNREYWITAKHVITGAKHPPYGSVAAKSVSLRMLDPGSPEERWLPITFRVIDTGKDIDIVVLAPPEPLLTNPLPSVTADSDGAYMGGDCEFLGFPFGGGWRATFENGQTAWMPFTKHCTVSDLPPKDIRVWILDGINNEGFSGGPVIFLTGPAQKIMAVVSGYITEPTDVIPSALRKPATRSLATNNAVTSPKPRINVNSGFMVAFDISYAINAIHNSPIGPMRKAQ